MNVNQPNQVKVNLNPTWDQWAAERKKQRKVTMYSILCGAIIVCLVFGGVMVQEVLKPRTVTVYEQPIIYEGGGSILEKLHTWTYYNLELIIKWVAIIVGISWALHGVQLRLLA